MCAMWSHTAYVVNFFGLTQHSKNEQGEADEVEMQEVFAQDEALFGTAGNAGIKLETRLFQGWQVSYRSQAPEEKHSDHWWKSLGKLQVAFQCTPLAEPRMHRSWEDKAAAQLGQRQKRQKN